MFAARLVALLFVLVACGGGGTGPGPAGFVLTVTSPTADAFQGTSGVLTVRVERQAGFTADITVTLRDPPEGVTAGTTTVTNGTEAQVSLALSPGVPVGSLALVVAGTSGTQSATAALTLNVRARGPSSQALIAQALAAGRVDLGTSLLYRAYALFGDPRLPSGFVGSGSDEEDLSLVLDIEDNRASLSAGTLAALQPFLARPSEPASLWAARSAPIRAAGVVDACTDQPESWATELSSLYPIRVWVRCPGTPEGNALAAGDLLRVLAALDKVYGPMTTFMGAPLPDQVGDSAIDVYVLPPGITAPRLGTAYNVQPFRGQAIAAAPFRRPATSAYLLLPTWRVREQGHVLTVIHEFFHVLQFAHNAYFQSFWFTEASATWASFHFNRTVPVQPPLSGSLHRERFAGFQDSAASLLDTTDANHPYYAYIWPLYMEHRADASLIAEAWRRYDNRNLTAAQGTAILDALLPFRDSFLDFALRNMNDQFLPGDPLPRDKRYIGLEKDSFPDRSLWPRNLTKLELVVGADERLALGQPLEPLSAGYFKVSVPVDPKLKQVVFDLEGLRLSGLDVDALVKIGGTWEGKPRDLNGKSELKFCLDRPEEKLEALWFILSNHQTAPGAKVSPEARAKGLAAPCGLSYSGHSSSIITAASPSYTITANVQWVLQPQAFPDEPLTFKATGSVTFEAMVSGCIVSISPSTVPIDLNGTALNGTHLQVDFSTTPPTYEGYGRTLWAATYTDCNGQSFIAGAGGDWFFGKGTTTPDGQTIKGPYSSPVQDFNFEFVRDW